MAICEKLGKTWRLAIIYNNELFMIRPKFKNLKFLAKITNFRKNLNSKSKSLVYLFFVLLKNRWSKMTTGHNQAISWPEVDRKSLSSKSINLFDSVIIIQPRVITHLWHRYTKIFVFIQHTFHNVFYFTSFSVDFRNFSKKKSNFFFKNTAWPRDTSALWNKLW